MPELIEPDPQCLSALSISKLASRSATAEQTQAWQRHADACARCASKLQDESALFRAAQLEPVPAQFLNPVPPKRRRLWWAAPALAGALAISAVFVLNPEEPSVRTKGDAAIHIAVKRGSNLILHDVPVSSDMNLKPTDQVRFRVLAGGFVEVQNRESDGTLSTVYTDAVPADGWLPFALALTEDGPTEITILRCPQPIGDAPKDSCERRRLQF